MVILIKRQANNYASFGQKACGGLSLAESRQICFLFQMSITLIRVKTDEIKRNLANRLDP